MQHREYKALHAEWYELRSAQDDHTKEIDFWTNAITAAGEPALELGSGTGRVLLPLLDRGLDVVGIDTSPEMTARCLAAAEAMGLSATVYEDSMLDFDLGQQFGAIFLDSGGLGLFTSDSDIETLFERVTAHLRPGGTFIYEFEPAPREARMRFTRTDSIRTSEGAEITLGIEGSYEPSTHIWMQTFTLEKSLDGDVVATETNERAGRYFTIEEAASFAGAAGFEDVHATDWLTDDPPRDGSPVVTVRCVRPG